MDGTYIFRKGIVQDVDNDKHLCRVKYPDLGFVSSWIYVPGTPPYFITYEDPDQHTEDASGGSGDPAYAPHHHMITVIQWMPKIGDTVVVACEPIHNGDAYVIGGLY